MVNVALGSRQASVVADALERLSTAGYIPPSVYRSGGIVSGYIIDREREIELTSIPVELEPLVGFCPASPFLR